MPLPRPGKPFIIRTSLAVFLSLTAWSIGAQELTGRIDSLFKEWNTNTGPGCAIGIVRNDSLIYAKGFGLANMEYNVPITPETIFHMASVSKQFTAYSIVLLARQGKIRLDEDIHTYLPWFPAAGYAH